MFCKSCGAELNDTAEFCSQCGKKVGGTQITVKINKKSLVAIAVVILTAIIGLVFVTNNNINASPEKLAAAVIKSEYEIDIKTMMKCFPDFAIREIAVDEGLSENASRSEVVKKVQESYRYETPRKVEIVDAEIVGEFDISEYTIYRELYDYMTDKDYDMITEVAQVKVEFTVDGDEGSVQVTCIKMKNKWYFLRGL